jgi:hypothetical protein
MGFLRPDASVIEDTDLRNAISNCLEEDPYLRPRASQVSGWLLMFVLATLPLA